jgi:methanogenic corrinoid protein MtbC1
MVDFVSKKMFEHNELERLLNGNPISLIENNHKNHIQFMSNVIRYKQADLFVHTLPWVYKAYSSKGVNFDYFKLELIYWIEAINTYCDEGAKKPLVAIYELMLKWHEQLIVLSETVTNEIVVDWTANHQKLLDMMLNGNYKEIMKYSKVLLEDIGSISDYYIHYLQPVMYKIGKLWEENEISVAHEHLATSTTSRLMASLYPEFVMSDQNKGKVVIASTSFEEHQIGIRMVADLLEKNGWDVDFLGANIPVEEVMRLISEQDPFIVAFSLTMSYHLENLVKLIDLIRLSKPKTKIMVGGYAINNEVELQHLIDADAFPINAAASVEIANKWWEDFNED